MKLECLMVPNGFNPGELVKNNIQHFLGNFKPIEIINGASLVLMYDKKSDAYYFNCHLDSKAIAQKFDLNAVLDPEDSEEYKLNRKLYTDTYAYQMMAKDAKNGRSFEDLVVEYDFSYRPEKPFKVFGGQHRVQAISDALKGGSGVVPHGMRVYFGLTIEQKVEIATVNNTSITVADDLLDRMQEELLGDDLRKWCQTVGLLAKSQNFADKRNADGVPTVRIARTLVVNFYLGRNSKPGSQALPIVCSTGPGL